MVAVQDGKYGESIAQVIRYVYSITRPGGPVKPFRKGVLRWRDEKGFMLILGEEMVSGKKMKGHGLVNIARRKATNGYETAVQKAMRDKWEICWHIHANAGEDREAKARHL